MKKKKFGQGFKNLYQFYSDGYDQNKKDYIKGQKRLVKAKTSSEAEAALDLIRGAQSNQLFCKRKIDDLIVAAEDVYGIEWDELEKDL